MPCGSEKVFRWLPPVRDSFCSKLQVGDTYCLNLAFMYNYKWHKSLRIEHSILRVFSICKRYWTFRIICLSKRCSFLYFAINVSPWMILYACRYLIYAKLWSAEFGAYTRTISRPIIGWNLHFTLLYFTLQILCYTIFIFDTYMTFRKFTLLVSSGNCHYIDAFLLVLHLRVMVVVGIESQTITI
jgi:hypothetical protein